MKELWHHSSKFTTHLAIASSFCYQSWGLSSDNHVLFRPFSKFGTDGEVDAEIRQVVKMTFSILLMHLTGNMQMTSGQYAPSLSPSPHLPEWTPPSELEALSGRLEGWSNEVVQAACLEVGQLSAGEETREQFR